MHVFNTGVNFNFHQITICLQLKIYNIGIVITLREILMNVTITGILST